MKKNRTNIPLPTVSDNLNKRNIFEHEINITEASTVIANALKDISGTFETINGWVLCDVGGTFLPSCREMEVVLGAGPNLPTYEPFGDILFEGGRTVNFDGPAHRLYYETLRRNTNIQFFSIVLQGQGAYELKIFSQSDNQQSCIANIIFDMDDETGQYTTDPIEVNTLLSNGSLVLSLRCISESGLISEFRWKGHVQANLVNAGERVIAIRTFGNRASVASSLKAIVNRLSVTNPKILARTLFVIYDATGDEADHVISDYVGNARMIELRAPNYGGGGNASALVSMILRAGKISDKKISEVILFDDDAHIDAETIVRHDAFVTARKSGVVSTAVIYSRQRPTIVQEFGGIWGSLFSSDNHRITATAKDSPRLFFPYLVRSNRDISEQFHARYIGKHQEIEFSTFIFISFPYECLSKVGAPLPVFLRNDDAEICLRMLANGYKVIVNPNLSAWHDSAHNPISEFYATLHGLILNSRYGGISRSYFYRILMQRLSCLATAGNLVLLVAYTKALELYAAGPDWMSADSIYGVYAQIRMDIGKIMTQDASQIPFEVVEILKNQDRVCIRNIVDPIPVAPDSNDVFFVDTKDDAYFSFKHSALESRITKLLEQSIEKLNFISNNFDTLITNWSDYVSDFDHMLFWDELLGKNGISVTGITEYENLIKNQGVKTQRDRVSKLKSIIEKHKFYENNLPDYSSSPIFAEIDISGNRLPKNFDPENYLRLNPDVASSGINPSEHWLNYGRHENRQY